MNLHFTRPRAAFAALALLIAGCAEGTTEPQRPPQVTIASASARVGNMVTAYVSGVRITEQQIPATLNDVPLTLVRQNDTTLVGLVPEMATGFFMLRFKVNGVETGSEFLVTPAPYVEDAVVTVNATLDSVLAEFSFAPPPGMGADAWAAHRDNLDSLIVESREMLASATPAEQLAAARLLVTARQAGMQFNNSMRANLTFECANASGKALLSIVTLTTSLGVTVSGLVIPGGWFLTPIGGVLLYQSWPHALVDVPNAFSVCSTRQTVDFTSDPGEFSLRGGAALMAANAPMAAVNDDMLFRLGESIPVTLTERVTSLSLQDQHEPEVARLVAALDALHNVAAQVPASVKKFLPTLPPQLPATPQTITATVAASRVRIGSVSTNAVTLTLAQSNGRATIRANSQQFGDIPFQFSLWNADNQNGARRVNAILRVGDDSTAFYSAAIQGNWTVTHLSANPQTVYQMTVMPDGVGEYTVNGLKYRSEWYIVRGASGKYYLYDEEFWHPAYWYMLRDPLKMPMTGFTTYDDDGTPAIRYTKN